MKVYLFFVNHEEVIENILNIKVYQHDVSDYVNGDLYSLFAFTDKKKYAEKFYRIHNKDYFILIERNMEKEEYDKFRRLNYIYELDKYKYENKDTSVELITTLFEYDECKHFWIDHFSENLTETFGFIPYTVIETLKDEYRDALYKLGLNTMLLVADEEFSGILEGYYQEFDEDYILRIPAETHSEILGRTVTASISLGAKTLNSFIHIFKDILTDKL